jgi:AhpD family alkylhydroperoxidase
VIVVEFEEVLKKVLEDGPEGTSKEWMNDIQSEYGRVPLIFRRMAERPEVLISHLLYKGTVISTSSIEPKYVELISLAVGSALKCPHCVEYHMQAAMRKGATRDEILEVVLIAGMLANSAILANAYRIIDNVESCAACDVNGLNGKVKKSAEKAPEDTKPKGRRTKRTAPSR